MGVDITDPVAASYDVLNGTDIKVDVVKASLDHTEEEQLFLVMAGLGYDAIMANTVDELKDRVGWLAYVEAGIRHLPGKPVRPESQHGSTAPGPAAGPQRDGRPNCGQITGGVEVFPDARLDDNILRRPDPGARGQTGLVHAVLAGTLFGRKNGKNGKNKSVRVLHREAPPKSASDHEQEFQLDGDHLGKAKHLRVAVEHGALTLRMTKQNPPGARGQLPGTCRCARISAGPASLAPLPLNGLFAGARRGSGVGFSWMPAPPSFPTDCKGRPNPPVKPAHLLTEMFSIAPPTRTTRPRSVAPSASSSR